MAKGNSAHILRKMDRAFRDACPTSHLRAAQVVSAHQGSSTLQVESLKAEMQVVEAVRQYTMPDGTIRTLIVS